ncbi:FAM3C-like [Solea senegalensis]|uniref:FAM3C-like n=1 Tax=Solea senegalensis TaxID=28829 RepID=A0AAV6QLA2_SOLSE|nr:FAM3C-like [Solea senegalensis]
MKCGKTLCSHSRYKHSQTADGTEVEEDVSATVDYGLNRETPGHRLYMGLPRRKNESDLSSVTAPPPVQKCNLSEACPDDSFAFRIRSGAANIVGPTVCFDGKIAMSHVLNNVGPGLNIVLVNGMSGVVEDTMNFNRNHKAEELVQYLKDIQPGKIVLAASFDDLAAKLTDESRELFAKLGSNLLKSLNSRDNWVFVGGTGSEHISAFEKLCPSDEKTNVYEGWPDIVELSSCYPRMETDADQP